MEKELNIALLIDSDNISSKYYNVIINELEELGKIPIKRVYGNFSNNNEWSKIGNEKGLTPKHIFNPIKGKNSTDILMVIEAMDIFYSKQVDAICLATSDSDFARLSQRLREGQMYMIVAGNKNTPIALNNSCDKFLMLDDLLKIKKDNTNNKSNQNQKDNVEKPKIEQIKIKISKLINENEKFDGYAKYDIVLSGIEKAFPQFNFKLYNVNSKKEFFNNIVGCVFRNLESETYIRLNKKNEKSLAS